jgi:hypothetical protein
MESRVKHWTDARMRSFIVSTIRGGFGRYPNKYSVLKNAFVSKKINKDSGRKSAHYRCAGCKLIFPSARVAVDHIAPVVDPVTGFVDWNTYIDRMFCAESGLQVLCETCHTEKTKEERKLRECKDPSKKMPTTGSPSPALKTRSRSIKRKKLSKTLTTKLP